jgi:uncharacterized protein with FMN-binding domain
MREMEEKKSVSFASLLISAVVAVVLLFGVKTLGGSNQVEEAKSYTAGTYTATASGMDEVTVTVTIDENGVITALDIDASKETPSLGQVAAPKLQEQILAAGTIDGIDAISGSTMTSNGIFTAITDCLSQASN